MRISVLYKKKTKSIGKWAGETSPSPTDYSKVNPTTRDGYQQPIGIRDNDAVMGSKVTSPIALK
jgi:hypothetical protein